MTATSRSDIAVRPVTFHYPAAPSKSRAWAELSVPEDRPFWKTRAYAALLRQMEYEPTAVLVSSPALLERFPGGRARFDRDLAARQGVVRFQGDFDRDLVEAHWRDARVQRLLRDAPDDLAFHVYPRSRRPAFVPVTVHQHLCTVVGDDAHLCLMPQPALSDMAHEITHVPMQEEGYPVFRGDDAADAMMWTSIFLDIEVDRRVTAAGIATSDETDAHLASKRGSEGEMTAPYALGEYVMRSGLPTATPAARDRYLSALAAAHPLVRDLGPIMVDRLDGGAAMRSAATATAAMGEFAELLRRQGVADFFLFRQERTPGTRNNAFVPADEFTRAVFAELNGPVGSAAAASGPPLAARVGPVVAAAHAHEAQGGGQGVSA